jgi:glycerol-3-phosphate acyltransferase PlsY
VSLMAIVLIFTITGFTLGSLPFSLWVGYVFAGVDVRDYGADGNPGAGNAWRAGGWRLGLLAAALDLGKGCLPVWAAIHAAGLTGWSLVPVALAPVLGHVFSPVLGMHGGKGVAAAFGVWIALVGLDGALLLAVCLGVIFALQSTDAWTVVLGTTIYMSTLVVRDIGWPLVTICASDLTLFAYRHRRELPQAPHLRRPRLARRTL